MKMFENHIFNAQKIIISLVVKYLSEVLCVFLNLVNNLTYVCVHVWKEVFSSNIESY